MHSFSDLEAQCQKLQDTEKHAGFLTGWVRFCKANALMLFVGSNAAF